MKRDFQNSDAALACSDGAQNLKFEREDWSLFRTLDGLQQRSGVPKDQLRCLVLKELVDNGLDNGGAVEIGKLPKGGYFVADDGSGIDGSPEDIARLFSINRPMVSTKLLRLPTRGALGNGLRVVAGTVLASEGSLAVITRNRRIELRPERDGSTTVVSVKPVKFPVGTRVEISFGVALPGDEFDLAWAQIAQRMAVTGTTYLGKSSPHWYDVPQFHELLYASGETPVRELIAQLDGCTGGTAGEIVAAAGLNRAICKNVTAKQAARLLEAAQEAAKLVNPKRLGCVGPEVFPARAYAYASGTIRSDDLDSAIPFVVEAWARVTQHATGLMACVNRTPVTGEIDATRNRRDIDVFGCGLSDTVAKAAAETEFDIFLNIITPYMPITSDGKAPNLEPFLTEISAAIGKAVRKARHPGAGSSKLSQKDVVLDNLDAVIAVVGGGMRFNQRQLLYKLRPIVMSGLGEVLKDGNFGAIITDYEAEHGEIPGMYREPRGSITHPHRGETITLGTLMVEEYERPIWTFNKLVYIEKEGANEALKEVRWPERHDCAVMSSKGFSTRAARDLIDKLAEHDEPVEVFCVHDADAPGTVIYQTLQEATKARGARKIKIINLGLEPWEAIEMGLEVETIEESKRRKPVADYVKAADESDEHGTGPGGGTWEDWLQTHRVELNAMTTPEFIAWLDAKMAEHAAAHKIKDGGKLIPPPDVLEADLAERIEKKTRAIITERILREAKLDKQVKAAVVAIKKPSAAVLAKGIKGLFKAEPDREWRDHIETVATDKTKKI